MNIAMMGDPHLGRAFKTGVPLHRIGEREASVWRDFENSLMNPPAPLHVNMGDLFDKFVVAPEVLLRAVKAYQMASYQNPGTLYVILRGNHDVSRDSLRASTFDVFTEMVSWIKNVKVVGAEPWVHENMGFVGFDPFQSAEEQIAKLPDNLSEVFTHFDYADWGGQHVLPTKLLAEKGIPLVFNGHDHLPRTETRHGVKVVMTGSLQPYAHGEDADGRLYRTVTLDQLALLDATNLNIRVRLKEGESLPENLDCLSLIAQRVTEETEAVEVDTSEFDGFDLEAALTELLPESIREEVMGVYRQ